MVKPESVIAFLAIAVPGSVTMWRVQERAREEAPPGATIDFISFWLYPTIAGLVGAIVELLSR